MVTVVYNNAPKGWIETYSNAIIQKSSHEINELAFEYPKTPVLSQTIGTFISLPRLCRNVDDEVIHFLSNSYLIGTNPRSLDKKVVVTVHHPYVAEGLRSKIWERLHMKHTKHADHIIAVSEHTKKDLSNKINYPEEKITVAPVGVNLNQFQETRTNHLDLPDEYLLHVGGGFKSKNYSFLLELFAEIVGEFPELYLVLAGSKDQKTMKKITKKAKRLGISERVRFTGWIDEENMSELYSRAKIYLQPSTYEGLTLPPIEAMACGTPIVVSNRSSLPELVERKELIAPLNIKKYASKVRSLLEDDSLYQEVSKTRRRRAKKFSTEKVVEKIDEVYQKL